MTPRPGGGSVFSLRLPATELRADALEQTSVTRRSRTLKARADDYGPLCGIFTHDIAEPPANSFSIRQRVPPKRLSVA